MSFMLDLSLKQIQEQFPDLEVMSFVGEGTSKAVFKVKVKASDEIVALKILSPDRTERLVREAHAMRLINSPYVSRLIEFKVEESQQRSLAYLLEEFIDGQSLEYILGTKKIYAVEEIMSFLDKTLQALEECWKHKIVHRDIKPANIMVRPNSDPVIIDFGLARHIELISLTPTLYPDILGTPLFAAPEILYYNKAQINNTSDLYALGITTYMMITGKHPFISDLDAKNISIEWFSHQMNSTIAAFPHELNPNIPEKLSKFVLRLMERKPIERFKDAKQARQRLLSVS